MVTGGECENPDAGSRVTGFFDAFVERAPTQRGFNYADITVIKPINACHCAPSRGPQRLSGPIHNPGLRASLRAAQKHSTSSRGDTRTHRMYLQSNLHRDHLTRRGKTTTKNGEENINTVTLPIPSMIREMSSTEDAGASERAKRRTTAAARRESSGAERLFRSIGRSDRRLIRWWNSMERNASRGIVSVPLNLLNSLRRDDRTRVSSYDRRLRCAAHLII